MSSDSAVLSGSGAFERIKRRRRRHNADGAGTSGPTLVLSGSTITDAAVAGDIIGTLGVLGGVGTYTFTFNSNPGTLFKIVGNLLEANGALVVGVDPISVHADNGAGSTANQVFAINVIPSGGGGGTDITYFIAAGI